MVTSQVLLALFGLPAAILAHPGENVEAIKREMAQRNTQHAYASRALAKCQDLPQAVALRERMASRRAAKAMELREKRGLTSGNFQHFRTDGRRKGMDH